MGKISIAVNPRDLREALQKALGLVPDARVLGLLRTLEKIATKRSDPEPFEVGVTSLRIVGGRFAIEPRGEDLLKESVVTSLLCRVDRKMLVQLHSCLFEQLWRGDSEPAKGVGGESLEVKKKGVERAEDDSVPAPDSVPGRYRLERFCQWTRLSHQSRGRGKWRRTMAMRVVRPRNEITIKWSSSSIRRRSLGRLEVRWMSLSLAICGGECGGCGSCAILE